MFRDLCQACENRNLVEVERLLEQGAPVNLKPFTEPNNHYRQPALCCAVDTGHFLLVKLLLEYDADPNLQSAIGGSPLVHAVSRGFEAIVKLLLHNGAKMEVSGIGLDIFGYSNILFFAINSKNPEALKILFEFGADAMIHTRSGVKHDGDPPLLKALEQGSFEMMRLLLDYGADVKGNSKGLGPLSPLLKALWQSDLDSEQLYNIVECLLQHGADSNEKLHSFVWYEWRKAGSLSGMAIGATPLHIAVKHDCISPAILQLLLAYGGDP